MILFSLFISLSLSSSPCSWRAVGPSASAAPFPAINFSPVWALSPSGRSLFIARGRSLLDRFALARDGSLRSAVPSDSVPIPGQGYASAIAVDPWDESVWIASLSAFSRLLRFRNLSAAPDVFVLGTAPSLPLLQPHLLAFDAHRRLFASPWTYAGVGTVTVFQTDSDEPQFVANVSLGVPVKNVLMLCSSSANSRLYFVSVSASNENDLVLGWIDTVSLVASPVVVTLSNMASFRVRSGDVNGVGNLWLAVDVGFWSQAFLVGANGSLLLNASATLFNRGSPLSQQGAMVTQSYSVVAMGANATFKPAFTVQPFAMSPSHCWPLGGCSSVRDFAPVHTLRIELGSFVSFAVGRASNRVFAVVDEGGATKVVALDAETGARVDQFQADEMSGALGVALGDDETELFVTDGVARRVLVLDAATGHTRRSLAGAPLVHPWAIAAHGPMLYVADQDSIRVMDAATGRALRELGRGILSEARGVAVSGSGRVFVADYGALSLVELFLDGTSFRFDGSLAARSVAVLGESFLVAADANGRSLVFSMAGELVSTLDKGVSPSAVVAHQGVVWGADGATLTRYAC